MSDYQQPKTQPTKVVSFTITNGTLTLKVNRPDVKVYDDGTKPNANDVPVDYLAAITQWIAEGQR